MTEPITISSKTQLITPIKFNIPLKSRKKVDSHVEAFFDQKISLFIDQI